MQYEIKGGSLPVVVCSLEDGETMITEAGGMSWMSPNMRMETTTGGGLGKVFGRMLSGEKLFQNRYTAEGGPGLIAFSSSFPGAIKPVEITPGNDIIVQKHAFLAAESGIELSVYFRKKLGAGLFGGEGFIMERLSGQGTAFLELDGYAVEYDLKPGQQLVASTGYVACMDATCSMDIQMVKGVKNVLFGGEGLFHTVVTGPGRVTLQSMPIINVAGIIAPYIQSSNK